jgi:hypothetical protein
LLTGYCKCYEQHVPYEDFIDCSRLLVNTLKNVAHSAVDTVSAVELADDLQALGSAALSDHVHQRVSIKNILILLLLAPRKDWITLL